MPANNFDFSIRLAQPEDCNTILQFIRLLAEYEHMSDQVVATEASLNKWLFEEHKAEVLIAEHAGKAVGFSLFFSNFSTFLGRPGIYLEDLFVLPEYRGRGIGRALLRRLAQLTLQRGYGRLEWACLDWNTPSIEFYRHLGAQSMDDWTTYRLTGASLEAIAGEEM